jgi:hypothetical protein
MVRPPLKLKESARWLDDHRSPFLVQIREYSKAELTTKVELRASTSSVSVPGPPSLLELTFHLSELEFLAIRRKMKAEKSDLLVSNNIINVYINQNIQRKKKSIQDE